MRCTNSILNFLGPWTSAGVDVVGTFYSTIKKDNTSVPDLEIMTFPVGLSQDNGIVLRKNLGISDKVRLFFFLAKIVLGLKFALLECNEIIFLQLIKVIKQSKFY